MRKITSLQILVFASLFGLSIGLAALTTWGTAYQLTLGDFRGVVSTVVGIFFLYVYGILSYRIFLRFNPLLSGEVEAGSGQEFVYHIYVLYYLVLFYPVMRSGSVPAPIMRVFYLALGTKLGHNTYSQGLIHDPPFIEIGNDSVVGQSALLIPHVIEGPRLAHYPIKIGNNVTIGAGAIVLCDVQIGDNAIVATGAVVTKGSRIPAGEVWVGMPARRVAAVDKRTDL